MARIDGNTAGSGTTAIGGAPEADSLIEELHRLQEREGHLSREALAAVAGRLQLPCSHVYGVASFYHLFLLRRPTPHRCSVCLGTACFVLGARQLAQRLAVALEDGDGDGSWTLSQVGCLGACGHGPVLVVDGQLLTRLPLAAAQAPELARRLQAAGLPGQVRP